LLVFLLLRLLRRMLGFRWLVLLLSADLLLPEGDLLVGIERRRRAVGRDGLDLLLLLRRLGLPPAADLLLPERHLVFFGLLVFDRRQLVCGHSGVYDRRGRGRCAPRLHRRLGLDRLGRGRGSNRLDARVTRVRCNGLRLGLAAERHRARPRRLLGDRRLFRTWFGVGPFDTARFVSDRSGLGVGPTAERHRARPRRLLGDRLLFRSCRGPRHLVWPGFRPRVCRFVG